MELQTINLNTEVVGTKTLCQGKTKTIVVNKYYDLDGQIINEGTDIVNFASEVPFEIVENKIRFNWKTQTPTFIDEWVVKVKGGEFRSDLEITGYKVLKTKLVLSGCTGAG